MAVREMDSPIGWLRLVATVRGLRAVHLDADGASATTVATGDNTSAAAIAEQGEHELLQYFARRRRAFDVPLDPAGTEFQLRVWDALRRIPYGQVISYGELARRVGNAAATRAVGAANGANSLAVIVPCHRVIASDGRLHGYGGGLWRKRALLLLEGVSPETAALDDCTTSAPLFQSAPTRSVPR